VRGDGPAQLVLVVQREVARRPAAAHASSAACRRHQRSSFRRAALRGAGSRTHQARALRPFRASRDRYSRHLPQRKRRSRGPRVIGHQCARECTGRTRRVLHAARTPRFSARGRRRWLADLLRAADRAGRAPRSRTGADGGPAHALPHVRRHRAPLAGLREKRVEFAGPIEDEEFGRLDRMKVPDPARSVSTSPTHGSPLDL
jgi:hypothetical protein